MRPELSKNLSTVLNRKELNRIPAEILEKIEKRFEEAKMATRNEKDTESEGKKEFTFFSLLQSFLKSDILFLRCYLFCAK